MGKSTRIDWADSSWNPVTGCLHGCEYCYAIKIAERFGSKTGGSHLTALIDPVEIDGRSQPYPCGFEPTFHKYRLNIPAEWKEPKTIFVCSMADLFGSWVPDEWIKEVFDACLKTPRHTYLFLTKNPGRYIELAGKGLLPDRKNFWYGSTVDHADQPFFYAAGFNTFVSVEPILEDFQIESEEPACHVDWVIIGAETGRRKDRVIPKKEWITKFVDLCAKTGTPLFMKESLKNLMGGDFIQQFPWKEEGF